MPTVIPNDALKAVLLKNQIFDIDNNFEHITFSFFTGAAPAKADLEAAVDSWHSHGWAQIGPNFLDWIVNTHGSTELLTGQYTNFQYQEHVNFTTVKFGFSRREELFYPSADGTAGWFIIILHNEGNPYNNDTVRFAAVGSVGAIGSGADLELTDTALLTSKAIKLNDISIDFNIQGVIS